jgi:hypothetical protein
LADKKSSESNSWSNQDTAPKTSRKPYPIVEAYSNPSAIPPQLNSHSSNVGTTTVNLAAIVSSVVVVCLLLLAMAILMRGRWKRNSTSKDTAQKVFTVFRKHTPEYIDEIELNLGDAVIIKESFDDGWAFGLNITTNNQGSFPLICLSVLSANENVPSDTKPYRHSSLLHHNARKIAGK